MRLIVIAFAVALLTAPAQARSAERDRHEFTALLDSVRVGMTEAEARAIISAPDDIRTYEDVGIQMPGYHVREVWCFGTAEHLAFPTLGQIGIDLEGNVCLVARGFFKPIAKDVLEETCLREILTTIDRIPSFTMAFVGPVAKASHDRRHAYNPRDVIRVVNALQPLGRKKAFAVLDEYTRLNHLLEPPQNIITICLVLFTPDPTVAVPELHLPWDELRASWPHFPSVVREGVPLWTFPLGSYGGSGGRMSTSPIVSHFRRFGVMRAAPFSPPQDPLGILARFESSPDWAFGPGETNSARNRIMNQLLWLVDTVCDAESEMDQKIYCPPDGSGDAVWAELVERCGEREIRWDIEQQRYVFGDGTFLDTRREPRRRDMWNIDHPGATVRVFVQRLTSDRVMVSRDWASRSGISPPPADMRVVRVDADREELTAFDDPGTARGSRYESKTFETPRGTQVQIELVRDGVVVDRSPIYTPQMTVLQTERLIVRRFDAERDCAFIVDLVNDPSWREHIGDKGVRTLDDALAYLERGPLRMYREFGFGLYAVDLKETGAPIGMCGLLRRDTLDDVDLGYAFRPANWGNGYAYESCRAVMAYAGNELGLTRIVAVTSQSNDASCRLLEKLGFSFERLIKMSEDGEELRLYGAG